MALKLTIVTAQRTVLEQDGVTKLVVPAAEGQITILPSHAALMSSLAIGEMVIHGTGVEHLAIHGGFIQVANEIGGDQVGTVGSVKLFPDLINVIPNKAVVTVDVRNTDEAKLKEAERRVDRGMVHRNPLMHREKRWGLDGRAAQCARVTLVR